MLERAPQSDPGYPARVLKLVATDLDGTLLRSDGTVSARTRVALTAVEERGVTVVFVTGRPVRWMESLWEHVGDHGLAICSNGGIVYDVAAHAVRTARPIPPGTGLEVARLVRQELPGTTLRYPAALRPSSTGACHSQRTKPVR